MPIRSALLLLLICCASLPSQATTPSFQVVFQNDFAGATDVSADGGTIVGSGRDLNAIGGSAVGWIVTIPEPGSLPLMALGLLGLRRRRRRGQPA